MELHEYYVKAIFEQAGLPVPAGGVAYTPQEAKEAALKIGEGPFWVKPQVLLGYSPQKQSNPLLEKKLAETPDQAFAAADGILGCSLQGFAPDVPATINRVYVERAIQRKSLCCFVFRVDFNKQTYTLTLFSEHAQKTFYLKDLKLEASHKKEILKMMKIHDRVVAKMLWEILEKAYHLFTFYGAVAVELNPIVQNDKTLVVVDGRLIFDPDSLFRFPEIVKCQEIKWGHEREALAKKNAFRYTKMDGNIACLVNGIGLGWATIDLIHQKKGRVACLLDVGTEPSANAITKAMKLALAEPNVDGILVNIFGGLTGCKTIAEGVLAASPEIATGIPVVVRMAGLDAAEGTHLLNHSISPFWVMNQMTDAVSEIVKQVKGGK
ncbi:MAG: ATP-grasp domain-containing protein [Alphaproteobacteria bacterium]